MRVDRIALHEIRLELKEPFRISSGEVRERRIMLLELHDTSGASVEKSFAKLTRLAASFTRDTIR